MKPRGRPANLTDTTKLIMFLRAVNDHPWAGPGLIQSYSGLNKWELIAARQRAEEFKLVKSECVNLSRRPPIRYALNKAGANYIGDCSLGNRTYYEALFRVHHLDIARYLLNEWALTHHGLNWAISPFKVYAADLRPIPDRPPKETAAMAGRPPDPFLPLRVDAIGSLCLAPDQNVQVVILVDPGDILIIWFQKQFRSLHAWSQRPEFRQKRALFPVFILIAANRTRLDQLIALWRGSARYGQRPETLFAITRQALLSRPADSRRWWNTHYQQVLLFEGVAGALTAPPRPDQYAENDPRHRTPLTQSTPTTAARAIQPRVYKFAARRSALLKRHLALPPFARRVLEFIGRYPLLTTRDLIQVFGKSKSHLQDCLHQCRGLIEKLRKKLRGAVRSAEGWILSAAGIALLASQAGFSVPAYGDLRRWPVESIKVSPHRNQYVLSTAHLTSRFDHLRGVIEFMIGLTAAARRDPRLEIIAWDREYIVTVRKKATKAGEASNQVIVIPDAVGILSIGSEVGAAVQMPWLSEFWLEVDRSNLRGARLRRKLDRYYRARGGRAGLLGHLPRLLIVVDDEARAQALARRIRQLDHYYGKQLEALIATRSLLCRLDGRVDPTSRSWRRPGNWSELTYAFEGLPLSQPMAPEAINLVAIRKQVQADQARLTRLRRQTPPPKKAAQND